VLLRVEVVQEHLRDAGAVADEGDRLAVGRPLRVEVLAALARDRLDRVRLEVEHVHLPLAEA
jgi:hypothetical protein